MTLSWALENYPDIAYTLNFNDFVGSFAVMTCLLIGNNWNDTVDTWSQVSGGKFWVRVYFTTFMLLTMFTVLNIIISFVMEVFDSVSDETDEDV